MLTKEDCIRYFHSTDWPTTGTLLGVYYRATDLGASRFNFDIDFDAHSLSALDAYDYVDPLWVVLLPCSF